MNHDFFKGIKQWEFNIGEMKGKLPVFYYDTTSFTAIYTASTGRVKRLLPTPKMHPIEIFPGRCLVAFTAFEYRKTDIAPYNEFSIAFPITYDRPQIPFLTVTRQMFRRRITAHIWQLPVTTEIARRGGVDLYGYPKFLADIEFQKENDRVTCRLSERGEKILTLHGIMLPTRRDKVSRIQTYSVIEGVPLITNIFINPVETAQTINRKAAMLEIGNNHRIGNSLRGIGLSAAPIQYQYSPLNQAVLFAGRNLMDS